MLFCTRVTSPLFLFPLSEWCYMFASVALITFYDSKCSHVMLCWAAFSLMIVGYLLTLLCRISNGRSRGSSSLLLVAFVFVRDGIYRLTHSTQHSFSSRCHLRIPHGACGTALQGTARCETGMHDLASLVPLFVDVWTSGVHMFFFSFSGQGHEGSRRCMGCSVEGRTRSF